MDFPPLSRAWASLPPDVARSIKRTAFQTPSAKAIDGAFRDEPEFAGREPLRLATFYKKRHPWNQCSVCGSGPYRLRSWEVRDGHVDLARRVLPALHYCDPTMNLSRSAAFALAELHYARWAAWMSNRRGQ